MAVSQSGEAATEPRPRRPDAPHRRRSRRCALRLLPADEVHDRAAAPASARALAPLCEALSAALSGAAEGRGRRSSRARSTRTRGRPRGPGLAADAVAVGRAGATPPAHGMLLSVELPLVAAGARMPAGRQGRAGSGRAPPDARSTGRSRAACSTPSSRELSERLGGARRPARSRRGELDLEGDAGIDVAPRRTDAVGRRSRARIDGCASAMCAAAPVDARSQPIAGAPRAARERRRRRAGAAAALREGLAGRAGAAARRGRLGADADRADARDRARRASSRSASAPRTGVRLFAEEVSVGRGRPGRSGTRKAIKLAGDRRRARARGHATRSSGRAELERARAHAGRGRRRLRAGDPAQHLRPRLGRARAARTWRSAARSS